MSRFNLLLIVQVLFLSFAMATASLAKCPDYKINAQASNDKKIEAFMKNSWADFMNDRPEWAYDIGYDAGNNAGDRWSDLSLSAIETRKNKVDCLKKAFAGIKRSGLSTFNKVNYDIIAEDIELSLLSKKLPGQFLVLNQLGGVHTNVVDTLLNMQQNNKVEVLRILERLKKVPRHVEENKILLQEGLKAGVTAPQVVLKTIPAQFDTIIKKDAKDSVLYKPFSELKSLNQADREEIQATALKVISEKVIPSMQDLKDFLVKTYIPQARKTTSIQALPFGKEWYELQIREQTTTKMTADEIHQLGLNEVSRILKEMEGVKNKTGFKKDLKAFNQFLLTDPKFYYEKPEDLIRGYREISKLADAELPKLFKTLPRLTYGVREIPAFKAPAAPTAYYMSGSLTVGRAGFFEANTHDLKVRPKWGMEALTLHEAVPGHHLQIAIAQELGEMPEFRRYGGYTAFGEGWGLYAESLGTEMGFYKDPYSRYGQLTYEMWRAVRLVVDTGLHSKDWTRDQALKYFMDHMPKSQLESEVEIDRYIVWPGQALAYKVGQLKFLELRAKAKSELQDKFDIREFHDQVLSGGALPLTLLENRMNEWVKSQKTKLNKAPKQE